MAKWVLISIYMLVLVGCASASNERVSIDPITKIETRTITKYNVIGKRAFNKLKINPTTGLIELGSSEGNSGELIKLLNSILQAAAK